MIVDVVHRADHVAGEDAGFFQRGYLKRVKTHDLQHQGLDLLDIGHAVRLLDEQVAGDIGPLGIHADGHSGPAGQGAAGDEQIFRVAQRIVRTVAGVPGQILQFSHGFDRAKIAHLDQLVRTLILFGILMADTGFALDKFPIAQRSFGNGTGHDTTSFSSDNSHISTIIT